jgi:hypothetical protein
MIKNTEDFQKGFLFAEMVHLILDKRVHGREMHDFLSKIASGEGSLLRSADEIISGIEQEIGKQLSDEAKQHTYDLIAHKADVDARNAEWARIILGQNRKPDS